MKGKWFSILFLLIVAVGNFGFADFLEMDGNEVVIIVTGKIETPKYECPIPDKYVNSDKSLLFPVKISISKEKQVLYSFFRLTVVLF